MFLQSTEDYSGESHPRNLHSQKGGAEAFPAISAPAMLPHPNSNTQALGQNIYIKAKYIYKEEKLNSDQSSQFYGTGTFKKAECCGRHQ